MKTLSGRRRYLPKITAGANVHARAAAERQAINTAVQVLSLKLVEAAEPKISSDHQNSEIILGMRRGHKIVSKLTNNKVRTQYTCG